VVCKALYAEQQLVLLGGNSTCPGRIFTETKKFAQGVTELGKISHDRLDTRAIHRCRTFPGSGLRGHRRQYIGLRGKENWIASFAVKAHLESLRGMAKEGICLSRPGALHPKCLSLNQYRIGILSE
jgi:hypothetical protein